MTEYPRSLVLDLVEWVAKGTATLRRGARRLAHFVSALTVWEDAAERGLVERTTLQGHNVYVVATDAGRTLLQARGRSAN